MNYESALLPAALLVKVASAKQDSGEPVDDQTWADLVKIGIWAKSHARYPGLVKDAMPSRNENLFRVPIQPPSPES